MAVSAPDEVDLTTDGRHLRRAHNRDAVLDALLELFEAGVYQPSAAEIAERAGISPRSLFRYFDDVDDLARAAIERHLERARSMLEVAADADDPMDRRITAVVDARVRLYEHIGPSARAGRATAHRHATVAARIRGTRALLRRQLVDLFPELSGARGRPLLPAVDALCSFETYDLMRRDQGLSRPRAAAALRAALVVLLRDGRAS